ncbi:MAG: nickel/cobalt transporter [Anaerolineales bacterium]
MKLSRSLSLVLSVGFALSFVSTALAHPLSNFTINHYVGLTVRRDAVVIEYVLDMAEIPALQQIAVIDANGNSQPDPAETAPYHEAQCQTISGQIALTANGQPLALAVNSSAIEFPAGSGGLLTLRLTCGFSAPLAAATDTVQLEVVNNAYSDRLGWREIVVQAEGVALQGDFVTTSVSDKLRAYPEDLLSTPLDQRSLSLTLLPPGAQAETVAPAAEPQGNTVIGGVTEDQFMRLITLQDLTPWSVLVTLTVALVWGAAHAMTPGHGKTIVAAYLVGARGTAMHAVYLGLTTTITHTAGVFALGLITLFASQYILPETLFPWLGLISGVFVVGLGINMFIERIRGFLGKGHGHSHGGGGHAQHEHAQHEHEHAPVMAVAGAAQHEHTHQAGGHSHRGDHSPEHTHAVNGHSHSDEHHHRGDDHHDHMHGEGGHSHGGEIAPAQLAHLEQHDHEHGEGGHHHDSDDHHGGGHVHSHMPPDIDGQPATWRSLLALGISGGLLPCPSALVLLLATVALGQVGLGIVLVIVFSIGLAATLTGIGLLLVYARKFFERVPLTGRFMYLASAASAVFITVAGLGIVWQALVEMGILKL